MRDSNQQLIRSVDTGNRSCPGRYRTAHGTRAWWKRSLGLLGNRRDDEDVPWAIRSAGTLLPRRIVASTGNTAVRWGVLLLLVGVPDVEAAVIPAPSLASDPTGVLLTAILMALPMAFLAFRLVETRRDLRAAHGELGFAARTAALGTLTAHLLHGLRNPVAGLDRVVSAGSPQLVTESDWVAAVESTRRMRSLIEEVTRILREDSDLPGYELSPPEIFDHLCRRFRRSAAEKAVRIECATATLRSIDNRIANLVLMILENLLANALEASPCAGVVVLSFLEEPDGLVFRVLDGGPGIPAPLVPHLFQPGRTAKVGGSGLGLALSRQLARAAGAVLDLESTGPCGTVFRLALPSPLPVRPWSFRWSGNRLSSHGIQSPCTTGEPTLPWGGPSLRPGCRSVPTTST